MEEELAAFKTCAGARLIGRRILYWPVLVSTMAKAREMAEARVDEGTVIVAAEQTGGQGRMGRAWLSPKGSLSISIVLYPELERLPYLNMAASLATYRAIREVTGLKTEIKWPNDVLVGKKKVCGVLIESRVEKESLVYAIIGIGMNANFPTSDLGELSERATTLSDETGSLVSTPELLRTMLLSLDELYLLPFEDIYWQWHDNLATLGQRVQIRLDGSAYEGIAESIDRGGNLLLRLDDGRLLTISAGEVTSFAPV